MKRKSFALAIPPLLVSIAIQAQSTRRSAPQAERFESGNRPGMRLQNSAAREKDAYWQAALGAARGLKAQAADYLEKARGGAYALLPKLPSVKDVSLYSGLAGTGG